MANKELNSRLQNDYRTLEEWTSANPTPLKGEQVFVKVNSTIDDSYTILTKIGDGTTKFSQLPWASALSADVYDWAKSETKPEYKYSEIKNTPKIDTTLSSTSTNAVQNKVVTTELSNKTNRLQFNGYNSKTGCYRIFAKIPKTNTGENSCGTCIITNADNISRAVQNIYLVTISNRNSAANVRVQYLLKGSVQSDVTFGHYSDDDYYYFGVRSYTSNSSYYGAINVTVLSAVNITFDKIAVQIDQPTGWTSDWFTQTKADQLDILKMNNTSYASNDTHLLRLGYIYTDANYSHGSLLITSSFYSSDHYSSDIISFTTALTMTASNNRTQFAKTILQQNDKYPRKFYYVNDYENNKIWIYVYVTGGNGYGTWSITRLEDTYAKFTSMFAPNQTISNQIEIKANNDINALISTHNTNTSAHSDIRNSVTEVKDLINTCTWKHV